MLRQDMFFAMKVDHEQLFVAAKSESKATAAAGASYPELFQNDRFERFAFRLKTTILVLFLFCRFCFENDRFGTVCVLTVSFLKRYRFENDRFVFRFGTVLELPFQHRFGTVLTPF